jgi:hypothetical protein
VGVVLTSLLLSVIVPPAREESKSIDALESLAEIAAWISALSELVPE